MRHLLTLCAVVAAFAFLARNQVFSWPYYYDEADYMYAASLGWRANFTDAPSQPLQAFFHTGMRNLAAPDRRSALSFELRHSGDVDFYRHWHGPLYFYWLAAIATLHLNEAQTRTLSYVFPLLIAFAIYFGGVWLLPPPVGALAALLGSAFYLWSYTTIFSNEIAPHQLFVLCTLGALLFLMKWRDSGRPLHWYAAVVATACAFCTLEVALVLAPVLIGFAFAAAPAERPSLVRSTLMFLGTVLCLWPAAVLKLSFLKAYLFMAYLALFRTSPWGHFGFVETWRLRIHQSPWEWALLALALIAYFRFSGAGTRKVLLPPVVYSASMLLVLLRVNTETPRYMLPFLPTLQLAAGFVFASMLGKWPPAARLASSAAILTVLFYNTYAQLRAHPISPAPRLNAVIAGLRNEDLNGKTLLAPQNDVPMIHYYLARIQVTGYTDAQDRSELLSQRHFDAILNPGCPVDLQRQPPSIAHYLSKR